jgi:hypothetical protein
MKINTLLIFTIAILNFQIYCFKQEMDYVIDNILLS